jgi:predicted ATPase
LIFYVGFRIALAVETNSAMKNEPQAKKSNYISAMITQIDISNFRSIKKQNIPLKKLNILYGANGSGKSSVGYAPYVFRNFFVNPNQRLNSLFNLGFINLGGFENVICQNAQYDEIIISLDIDLGSYENEVWQSVPVYYKLTLTPSIGQSLIFSWANKVYRIELDLPSTLSENIEIDFGITKLLWNGLTFLTTDNSIEGKIFSGTFNNAFETIKSLEVISVRRGFFNPIFSTEQATEESLFAMQIRNEGESFESKIDHYFKKIFDKTFRFVAIPGSTSFYLKTQNSKGHTTDLVNEGFGVNQTVYMLAKLLKKSTSLAFIEEPEIHLHPSAQVKLVDAFTEIIQKEDKQIFLSTHSENIVSTILAKIAAGELNKDDVQFYLAKYEDGETKIISQEVNDKGQIEGGLMNFMETELDNLKKLLGV